MRAGALLCLCLAEESLEADRRLIDEYRSVIDIVELWVDSLSASEATAAVSFPRAAGIPVILTVRRASDGGRFAGSETDRVALLARLAVGGFAFVDLEEDLEAPGLEAGIRAAGSRIIRSFHDFSGVPSDLAARVRRLARNARELPKAAVMVRGTADLARLLGACDELAGTEKVVLGMGEHGFPSRVLAGKIGSRICFASAPGAHAAPGQTDPLTLERLFRFHSVGPATAVYGVIGNPVAHSLSPLVHNTGFAALGMDGVYLPFPVDDLAAFRRVADLLDIRGLSVTVPLKQAVIPLLSRRDALVEAAGACNTITAEPAGAGGAGGGRTWAGTNTDVEGFLAPLRDAFGGTIPRGIRATVVGAGGASRAVVHALVGSGAEVLVLNRTGERAQELARLFSVKAAALDGHAAVLAGGYPDLIVQTTSAGMAPAAGIDPFPSYRFTGREVVYELVYSPPMTPFLLRARDAGCRLVQGSRMFLAQAREQFRLFTGAALPVEAEEIV